MLIASKYEEIYAPEVRDFVYISDKAYTRDQILAMESIMLNTLGFYVTVPSTLRFCERFCKVAKCDEKTSLLAKYLIELTLQDYKFLKYLPSQIGAASVLIAQKMMGTAKPWNSTLEKHTTYTESDIADCASELSQLCGKEPQKYRAVRKKYSSSKYSEVNKPPPPHLLLTLCLLVRFLYVCTYVSIFIVFVCLSLLLSSVSCSNYYSTSGFYCSPSQRIHPSIIQCAHLPFPED